MRKFIKSLQNHIVGIVVIASLSLVSQDLLSQSDNTGESGDKVDFAAIQSGIDNLTVALEKTRAEINRARFEPSALVDSLDFDPESATAFVRDSIVYQPYPGTLRGVAGTLRAGAGNSLDQAILLANLLKTAGLDARIARGTLGDTDALRLLRSTSQAAPGDSLDYMQKTLAANFGDQAAQPPDAVAWKSTRLAGETGKLVDTLKLSLQNAGIDLSTSDVQATWLPIARQYFWVQYRDGPAQGWQDAHPAFGANPTPQGLAAEEYFADSVPEKYQHRLTVSAWVGQWLAGKIETRQIMTPWTRPVANLDAEAIRYRNAPSGLNLDNAGDLKSVIEESQMLVPMLNDATAPGAMAFDLRGRVIDPMALGGGAGVFQTMGDKMGNATSGLMDRKDKQPAMALNSMWLEFTFTAPGGAKTTYRRYLVGAANRP